ncbi:MAG TPA: cytochrome C [Burkholderiales bacterium]|nr:cytochrome C [Burkholderiales bacterium]
MRVTRRSTRWISLAALLAATLGACEAPPPSPPHAPGDRENGRLLLRQYGCGTCHTIPGVAAARGDVGPPLTLIARRAYVGGMLPNTPQNMARWIESPRSIDPLTRMPDMQVPPTHARDMVAYLYTLR